MPPAMLGEWVEHWVASIDPASELAPNKRLRFSGQDLCEYLPPLDGTIAGETSAISDREDDDDAEEIEETEDEDPALRSKSKKPKPRPKAKGTAKRKSTGPARLPPGRRRPAAIVEVVLPLRGNRSRTRVHAADPIAPATAPATPVPVPAPALADEDVMMAFESPPRPEGPRTSQSPPSVAGVSPISPRASTPFSQSSFPPSPSPLLRRHSPLQDRQYPPAPLVSYQSPSPSRPPSNVTAGPTSSLPLQRHQDSAVPPSSPPPASPIRPNTVHPGPNRSSPLPQSPIAVPDEGAPARALRNRQVVTCEASSYAFGLDAEQVEHLRGRIDKWQRSSHRQVSLFICYLTNNVNDPSL